MEFEFVQRAVHHNLQFQFAKVQKIFHLLLENVSDRKLYHQFLN